MYNCLTEIQLIGICDSGTDIRFYTITQPFGGTTAAIVGIGFVAPEDATIKKIGMSFNSSTGATARELKLAITGVTATGNVDTANILAQTAAYQYNDAAITYSATGGMTYLDITRDGSGNSISSYNITKGTAYFVGCLRENNTGWSSTQFITFNVGHSNGTQLAQMFHTASLPFLQSTSTAKQTSGLALLLSDDKCYGKGFGYHDSQTIAAGVTTNYGLRFKLPAAFGDTVSLSGIRFAADWTTGSTTLKTIDIKLWKDNGNGTATLLHTEQINENNCYQPNDSAMSWLYSTLQVINTDQDYIVTVCNENSTGNLVMHHYTYTDVRENTIFTCGYIPIRGVEVSSSGTITEIDKTYHINLLVEDFGLAGGCSATFGGMFNG